MAATQHASSIILLFCPVFFNTRIPLGLANTDMVVFFFLGGGGGGGGAKQKNKKPQANYNSQSQDKCPTTFTVAMSDHFFPWSDKNSRQKK